MKTIVIKEESVAKWFKWNTNKENMINNKDNYVMSSYRDLLEKSIFVGKGMIGSADEISFRFDSHSKIGGIKIEFEVELNYRVLPYDDIQDELILHSKKLNVKNNEQ